MKTYSCTGTHVISGLEQLKTLAEALARQLLGGDIVLLSGNLGAGKTTFTQFLGKALGVADKITSPTYTLGGEYPILHNPSINTLIHMDLYRMGQLEKKLPLNNEYIQEIMDSASHNKAIIVIEWAEKLTNIPSSRCWKIFIEPGNTPDARIVTIDRVQ